MNLKTKQVKRNINSFPKKIMFQLIKENIDSMVSQNAIPSKRHLREEVNQYVYFTQEAVLL